MELAEVEWIRENEWGHWVEIRFMLVDGNRQLSVNVLHEMTN